MWTTDQDPAAGGAWQAIGYTTRVTHLVDDLVSFKAYWFRVCATGTAGEGTQSDPALGRADIDIPMAHAHRQTCQRTTIRPHRVRSRRGTWAAHPGPKPRSAPRRASEFP